MLPLRRVLSAECSSINHRRKSHCQKCSRIPSRSLLAHVAFCRTLIPVFAQKYLVHNPCLCTKVSRSQSLSLYKSIWFADSHNQQYPARHLIVISSFGQSPYPPKQAPRSKTINYFLNNNKPKSMFLKPVRHDTSRLVILNRTDDPLFIKQK